MLKLAQKKRRRKPMHFRGKNAHFALFPRKRPKGRYNQKQRRINGQTTDKQRKISGKSAENQRI